MHAVVVSEDKTGVATCPGNLSRSGETLRIKIYPTSKRDAEMKTNSINIVYITCSILKTVHNARENNELRLVAQNFLKTNVRPCWNVIDFRSRAQYLKSLICIRSCAFDSLITPLKTETSIYRLYET